MATLNTKIKLYAKSNGVNSIDFLSDVIVEQSAGEEPKIITWNLDIPEPTTEQLESYNAEANTEESNQAVIVNRKSEYGSNSQQIENIIENGLVAEQARVQAIKEKYPKS